jgi:hypothetical protein
MNTNRVAESAAAATDVKSLHIPEYQRHINGICC